jgi:hypothetical protein
MGGELAYGTPPTRGQAAKNLRRLMWEWEEPWIELTPRVVDRTVHVAEDCVRMTRKC